MYGILSLYWNRKSDVVTQIPLDKHMYADMWTTNGSNKTVKSYGIILSYLLYCIPTDRAKIFSLLLFPLSLHQSIHTIYSEVSNLKDWWDLILCIRMHQSGNLQILWTGTALNLQNIACISCVQQYLCTQELSRIRMMCCEIF